MKIYNQIDNAIEYIDFLHESNIVDEIDECINRIYKIRPTDDPDWME